MNSNIHVFHDLMCASSVMHVNTSSLCERAFLRLLAFRFSVQLSTPTALFASQR